jgi:hypothetical protein
MAHMNAKAPAAGADGQINVAASFETPEQPGAMIEGGDDRVAVPVGSQQHGPNSPTHGAAGGYDVNFQAVAPAKFTPSSGETGMTTSHPALGG